MYRQGQEKDIFDLFLFFRVDPDTPAYEEPKHASPALYTVLYKETGPTAATKAIGTMVTVTQRCSKCPGSFVWKSQPPPVLGKCPTGNVLLSFAILKGLGQAVLGNFSTELTETSMKITA